MVDILLILGAIVLVIMTSFFIGKHDAEQHLIHENETLKRVQRNLNALVLDQKHQIQAVDGLWATDQPELIRHHAKRERFFRIGYSEDRL